MKGLKIGVAVEWVIQSAFINLQSSGVFFCYIWLVDKSLGTSWQMQRQKDLSSKSNFLFSVNSGSYSEEYRIHKSILKAWQNWFGIMPDSGVLKNVSLWRVCRLSTTSFSQKDMVLRDYNKWFPSSPNLSTCIEAGQGYLLCLFCWDTYYLPSFIVYLSTLLLFIASSSSLLNNLFTEAKNWV